MNVNFIQSLVKMGQTQQGTASRAFKPGQIVQGKIVKFFPNQHALVQIGGMKVHAQLEAALEAERRYWFQVQPNDQMLQLKVFEEPLSSRGDTAKGEQAAQALLKQFQLPVTKQNTALVQQLLKEGVPFTKENLQLASEWLKSSNDLPKAVTTIQTMLEKGLPFTKATFASIQALSSSETFAEQAQQLLKNLQSLGNTTATTQQLKQLLSQLIGQNGTKVSPDDILLQMAKLLDSGSENNKQVLQQLLTKLGGGDGVEQLNQKQLQQSLSSLLQSAQQPNQSIKQQALEQIRQLLFPTGQSKDQQMVINEFASKPLSGEERNLMSQLQRHATFETRMLTLLKTWINDASGGNQQAAHALLQRSGVVSQSLTAQQTFSVLEQRLPQLLTENPALKTALGNPNMQQQSNPQLLLQQMIRSLESLPQASQGRAIELLAGMIMKGVQAEQQGYTFTPFRLNQQELELLQTLRQQATPPAAASYENGSDGAKAFKQILNLFGFNYEQHLARQAESGLTQDQLNNVKALLLKLAQEPVTSQMRERVDQLLQRITGHQLVASEQSGPMQQLVMQFPIVLGSHLTDLNIQWSGKRKENGQIDPDYCRVLFYLELEQLKETIIDVHVQNRIVNIQLYNDTPMLEQMAKAMQPMLKENLETHRYTLSSLKITDPKALVQSEQNLILRNQSQPFQQSYTGVDYRI